MRVLLTRPQYDSERVATTLCKRGHEVIVSPLMAVDFVGTGALEMGGVQAIVATSANGIRALAGRTTRRNLPVFAVGPQTAAGARAAGFAAVKNAQGDSATLAGAVSESIKPEDGVLLHPAGAHHGAALASILSAQGFQVRTEIVYAARDLPSLSAEAIARLRARTVDAAMLFSPRSAQLFAAAVERANLQAEMSSLRAVCIGHAAAAALSSLPLLAAATAQAPNQDSMIALLEKPAQALEGAGP